MTTRHNAMQYIWNRNLINITKIMNNPGNISFIDSYWENICRMRKWKISSFADRCIKIHRRKIANFATLSQEFYTSLTCPQTLMHYDKSLSGINVLLQKIVPKKSTKACHFNYKLIWKLDLILNKTQNVHYF